MKDALIALSHFFFQSNSERSSTSMTESEICCLRFKKEKPGRSVEGRV